VSDLVQYFSDCALVTRHRPWPRVELTRERWSALADRLASENWEAHAIWADGFAVHVALRDPDAAAYLVATLDGADGAFASLAQHRPGLIRMERVIAELHGLEPVGLQDRRPWLDHGRWGVRKPLAAAPELRALHEPASRATDYPFLPVAGEGVHQIPVGPVHAGIIEPGHFRFHANGEAVVRLEARLGYVHKGTERLMIGKTVADAARLAGRLSGDTTVAHALAFARAVEAACDRRCPPRADVLRAIMLELERIANHLGDFGAICNDAAFAFLLAEASRLREDVLRCAAELFGHRLMMDCVVPGGVAVDLATAGGERLGALLRDIGARFASLVGVYEARPSLLDRTMTTGVVSRDLVTRFAAGGHVGRGSGRAFDARVQAAWPPYDAIELRVPVLDSCDVHARLMVRVHEVGESLRLIALLLERMPDGPLMTDLPLQEGEGLAIVEGFRGDILTWVRLAADGRVARCFPRDPSWLQWPLLEAAIEGNIVADFPLCNKSFNCSYSGHDR
jgi:Ni,Fe-hydrogenase III large subunit